MGTKIPAQTFAIGLAALLKEYADKIDTRLAKALEIRNSLVHRKSSFLQSTERARLIEEFSQLESALLNATRNASQLAEQGAVEDLSRVELRVRLAEVEGLLRSFRLLLDRE